MLLTIPSSSWRNARQHPPGLPRSAGVEASLGAHWGRGLLPWRSNQELCLNRFIENQWVEGVQGLPQRSRGSRSAAIRS